MQDKRIQRRLLSEGDLKFEKAYEVAQAMELASKNAEQLNTKAVLPVDGKPETLPPTVQTVRSQTSSTPSCYQCGYKGHTPAACRFKSATCHGCKKFGHLKQACKEKWKGSKRDHQAAIVEQESESSNDEQPL